LVQVKKGIPAGGGGMPFCFARSLYPSSQALYLPIINQTRFISLQPIKISKNSDAE
jgi:hypothetical protein